MGDVDINYDKFEEENVQLNGDIESKCKYMKKVLP